MSGGLHVFDMIKRLKENENLRKLNYFKKGLRYNKSSDTSITDDLELTPEKQRQLVNRTRQDQLIDLRKRIIILILSVVITGTLIGLTLMVVN